MHYFYYFQDTKTGLYYGGITDNALVRQRTHRRALKRGEKSTHKDWHLYQDKIQLTVLWNFKTKREACIYEKQWIINNYLNPLSLNCSVSNSEYGYDNHTKISEEGGGNSAKGRYALEVNSPDNIYTFKSSYEAAGFTKVPQRYVSTSCKSAKPLNGSGRWLFSDVSKADLLHKFKNLTKAEIKGSDISRDKTKGFILIDKNTGEQSQVFNSVYEPQKQNYKIHQSNLSQCLLGKKRTINGYYVTLCI